MERNRLDPDEPPMIGAEPQPSQWSWEVQKPLLKDFLLNALMLGPMGLRSGRGGTIGMDAVTAARLERQFPRDTAITGGDPQSPRRWHMDPSRPAYDDSSAGLAGRRGMVPAEEPLYRPGAYGDRHPGVSEPANINNRNWHKSQNPKEKYWEALEAQQFDRWARDNPDQLVGSLKDIWRERHPFDVIQGGLPPKKD